MYLHYNNNNYYYHSYHTHHNHNQWCMTRHQLAHVSLIITSNFIKLSYTMGCVILNESSSAVFQTNDFVQKFDAKHQHCHSNYLLEFSLMTPVLLTNKPQTIKQTAPILWYRRERVAGLFTNLNSSQKAIELALNKAEQTQHNANSSSKVTFTFTTQTPTSRVSDGSD